MLTLRAHRAQNTCGIAYASGQQHRDPGRSRAASCTPGTSRCGRRPTAAAAAERAARRSRRAASDEAAGGEVRRSSLREVIAAPMRRRTPAANSGLIDGSPARRPATGVSAAPCAAPGQTPRHEPPQHFPSPSAAPAARRPGHDPRRRGGDVVDASVHPDGVLAGSAALMMTVPLVKSLATGRAASAAERAQPPRPRKESVGRPSLRLLRS